MLIMAVNYDSVRNGNSEVAVSVTYPNNDVNGSGNFIESKLCIISYNMHGYHQGFNLLRIVFRVNYGYSNEYQSVDIKVLLHQNIHTVHQYFSTSARHTIRRVRLYDNVHNKSYIQSIL